MRGKFQDIRKQEKVLKTSNPSSYGEALLSTTSWVTHCDLFEPDVCEVEEQSYVTPEAPAQEKVIHEPPVQEKIEQPKSEESKPASERNKVLDSFYRFIDENRSKEGVLKFSGGTIELREEASSGDNEMVLREDFHREPTTLIQEITACKKCWEGQDRDDSIARVTEIQESGSEQVKVMFVGDLLVDPKVSGRVHAFSGEKEVLLDKMIQAMGLKPGEFLKTTVVKCAFPNLQATLQKSLSKNCVHYLHNEIALCKPQVVVTLGAVTTQLLLGIKEKLSKIHGEFYPCVLKDHNKNLIHPFQIVPIFHPDLLLINQAMKAPTWEDLKRIINHLNTLE